jgi:hypothetical protein
MVRALCARLKSYVRVAPPLHPGLLGLGPSLVLALRATCGCPNSIPSNLSSLVQRQFCREQNWARFSAPAGLAPGMARAKVTKESTPRMARKPPALLAGIGARLNSSGAELRASGLNTRLASPDSGCDARARHTGFGATPCPAEAFFQLALRGLLVQLILPRNTDL